MIFIFFIYPNEILCIFSHFIFFVGKVAEVGNKMRKTTTVENQSIAECLMSDRHTYFFF